MEQPVSPSIRRRALLRGGAFAAVAGSLPATSATFPLSGPDPLESLALWPNEPPGPTTRSLTQTTVDRENPWNLRDRAVRQVTRPTLTVFRPDHPNGAAMLLIPGGGYAHVVVDKEGFETARWLSGRGVTVFVLLYRLPGDGWAAGPDAPLQDAQRALRLIRRRAAADSLDPARIGVQGFSAGGHLAARLSTRFEDRVYAPVDTADSVSARPDFACLVYPVILMGGPAAHPGSARAMLGESPSADRIAAYAADTGVSLNTPPTFLLHAMDDKAVPVENSLSMLAALRRAGVQTEAHLFEEGGHGFGLRGLEDRPVAAWPLLFHDWAKRRQLF